MPAKSTSSQFLRIYWSPSADHGSLVDFIDDGGIRVAQFVAARFFGRIGGFQETLLDPTLAQQRRGAQSEKTRGNTWTSGGDGGLKIKRLSVRSRLRRPKGLG